MNHFQCTSHFGPSFFQRWRQVIWKTMVGGAGMGRKNWVAALNPCCEVLVDEFRGEQNYPSYIGDDHNPLKNWRDPASLLIT